MPDSRTAWPTSLPDYAWPPQWTSRLHALPRWLLAGLFHLAHAVGRLVALAARQKPAALVVRTDGIGDAVLFEPTLEAFARYCSPFDVHLWAPAATCELLAGADSVKRCRTIPRGFKPGNLAYFRSPAWRARMGYRLGRWKFDVVLYAVESPEPLGNWLLGAARAKERWYCPGDLHNQFDWQREKTSFRATRLLESRPGGGHELQRNAHLAAQWASIVSRSPRLSPTPRSRRRADAQLAIWKRHQKRLKAGGVVGVVAIGSMRVNRYPDDRWAQVIRRLWSEHRILCALLGAEADRPSLNQVAWRLRHVPHLRLTRPLDVLATAHLIGSLDGVLSVDTGLAHLAMAQDVATVALSTGGTPGRFLPWPDAPHAIVLNRPMPCEGCRNRCTLAEPECITRIEPDEIVEALLRLRRRDAEPITTALREAV